jgi:hypothetical protein
MHRFDLARTLREAVSLKRVIVTVGVAGTMGVEEWLGTGSPLGLLFGIGMGAAALLVAPLPWLAILPWGMKRPPLEIAARSVGVLAASAVAVVAGFSLYFVVRGALVPVGRPMVSHAYALLSAWSSVLVSIPLFAAAGWGISRHMQLERRLEVHDERELGLRNALEEARMHALQSRLDPHFLFNALNLVAELCREDPVEAERCVLRLSKLLRAALEHAEQPLVALSRELDLCVEYLELCRVRFGDRLATRFERAPEAEGARVPAMAVQVLCENAVRHGVERRPEGGEVGVVSSVEGPHVRVRVTSPGPFLGEREGGVGLDLTRRRLALAFGPSARLEVRTGEQGERTVADLVVPVGEGA